MFPFLNFIHVIQSEAWPDVLFSLAMYQVSPTCIWCMPTCAHTHSSYHVGKQTRSRRSDVCSSRGQSDTEDNKATSSTLLIEFPASCKKKCCNDSSCSWPLGSNAVQLRDAVTKLTQDLRVWHVFFNKARTLQRRQEATVQQLTPSPCSKKEQNRTENRTEETFISPLWKNCKLQQQEWEIRDVRLNLK